MHETNISRNPLHVMMEGLGIDIERSWHKARPVMHYAVATCVYCPSFDCRAANFEACCARCPNTTLFEHLLRTVPPRQIIH
jgi:hypothetical protein